MRLGLIADTHDDVDATRRALDEFEARDVDVILHAGDVTSGVVVPLFKGWRVWFVQGNMDEVASVAEAIEAVGLDASYGRQYVLDLKGCRIGLIHGDDQLALDRLIGQGDLDLVVHGHTHRFRDDRFGHTRIVNPGAVHRTDAPSVAVYDVKDDALVRVMVPDADGRA